MKETQSFVAALAYAPFTHMHVCYHDKKHLDSRGNRNASDWGLVSGA